MELRSEIRPSKKKYQIDVVSAKDGRLVPLVGGKAIHSRYEPATEGKRWAEEVFAKKPKAKAALVMGMGFAYHVEALRNMLGPDAPIVVFEPISEIVSAYAGKIGKNIDNVRLWPSPTSQDVVDAVAEVLTPAIINDVLIAGHPPSIALDPAGYQEILSAIHSTVDLIAMSLTTGWGFGFEWIENALRNVRHISEVSFLNQLGPHLSSAAPPAALVLGAGPSLDDQWDTIGKSQVLKLAADTALEPMQSHGVTPHLSFLFDSQIENARLVEKIHAEEHNLVTSLEVQPSIFEKRWRNIFLAGCDRGVLSWLERRGKFQAGTLKQGGSVVTCAFDLARQAGCAPIYFGGVDLSFSGHRVYCQGTAYERRAVEAQGRYSPLELVQYQMKSERTERVISKRPTQENLYNYFRWLKDEIGRTTQPVYILTQTGLLADFLPSDGAERISHEKFPPGFDADKLLTRFKPNGVMMKDEVGDALAEIRRGLESFLSPENFSDPDRLEKAAEASGISDIIEVVVQPAIAVSRYERGRREGSHVILKELRDRLAGLSKIN